jgi:hypothetical protein
LDAVVVDAATFATVSSRRVLCHADPRDPLAVRAALDEILPPATFPPGRSGAPPHRGSRCALLPHPSPP